MDAQLEHHEGGKEHATAESGGSPTDTRDIDVFQIPATDALKAFITHLTELARITGDVPAIPYAQQPPNAEDPAQSVDVIAEKRDPTVSIAELHWADVKDAPAETGVDQHNVLVKRFYSKKAPPISLDDYLSRLHKYCPMSTAVYLAASLYITRMVFTERALSVTPRNVHRLVLAALRVAMKALEDLSYPHSRFARVGGVAERELTRLEITFCFLTDFDLGVDAPALLAQAKLLWDTPHVGVADLAAPPAGRRNDTASTVVQDFAPEIQS
jgi:Cyclin